MIILIIPLSWLGLSQAYLVLRGNKYIYIYIYIYIYRERERERSISIYIYILGNYSFAALELGYK